MELEEGVVKDIRERFDDPKPARNTISTVLKVLERRDMLITGPMRMYSFIILLSRNGSTQNTSFSDCWRGTSTIHSGNDIVHLPGKKPYG
jgi:hypothetical protein